MKQALEHLAYTRDALQKFPSLRYVFLELTRLCNLKCKHCGSRCASAQTSQMLTYEDVVPVIDSICAHTDSAHTMFCITGGEPLLNPQWFEICSYISSKGFLWGMTSNGTYIDVPMVQKLKEAGMASISISIDGTEVSHERLRCVDGCYQKSIQALSALVKSKAFMCVQAITVVSPWNVNELDTMFHIMRELQVDSWKLTEVEPIGDARAQDDLVLTKEQYRYLFDFIKQKRAESPFEVTYGCSHFLPLEYDDIVRNSHFLCGAGILIASITAEGDIVACLDIDERERTKQGNIHTDDFWTVWENKFRIFREPKVIQDRKCQQCAYVSFCQGDSWHTWDFDTQRPRVCLFQKIRCEGK